MKIRCEIIAIETHGDSTRIDLQGMPATAAAWRPLGRHTMDLPSNSKNNKALHIGRIVEITIKMR